jgi:hypothetical protein
MILHLLSLKTNNLEDPNKKHVAERSWCFIKADSLFSSPLLSYKLKHTDVNKIWTQSGTPNYALLARPPRRHGGTTGCTGTPVNYALLALLIRPIIETRCGLNKADCWDLSDDVQLSTNATFTQRKLTGTCCWVALVFPGGIACLLHLQTQYGADQAIPPLFPS